MNLDPRTWFARKDAAGAGGGGAFARESQPYGPWTGPIDQWVAREVAPQLYESLREAIPVLDAAINRLVTLDGIVRFEAESDALAREADDWMQGVQVGDMQQGFQAFFAGQGNELYEQGFTLGEWVLGDDGREVTRLNVADSKGVIFRRQVGQPLEVYYRPPMTQPGGNRDGKKPVEQVLRNGAHVGDIQAWLDDHHYQSLDRSTLVYAGLHVENDNPYGVSIMRSMEFCAQILLVIDNAIKQGWQRFGDPSFSIQYETKRNLPQVDLDARQKALATNLGKVVAAKQKGKSADFVTAMGSNDKLTVDVLGAGGEVLDIEPATKHLLEQIVAKTGLPPWILGYVWGTAERLALKQAELLLQESRTRWGLRAPALRRPVEAALRARGVTWQPGDWQLVQELPNLQDVMAMAQAEFLQAQTELMRSNAGAPMEISTETAADGKMVNRVRQQLGTKAAKNAADSDDGEPYAEADPDLPQLERAAIAAAVGAWHDLRDASLDALGLATAGKSEGERFVGTQAMVDALLALQNEFVAAVGAADGVLLSRWYQAWVRGVANAAAEVDAAASVAAVTAAAQQAIADRGLSLVRNVAIRAMQDDIIELISDGELDGSSPRVVAQRLRERFESHDYDWERLARSELTQAHGEGKMHEYAEMEITQYNYVTAGDSRVSSVCRGHEAAGPYQIGDGPLPMRDSHPNCRCTVTAVVD